MKMKIIVITFFMLASVLELKAQNVGTTSFQFLKVIPTARASAMGDAYTAGADGADAAMWNPACLTKINQIDINLSYADWFFDSQISSASAAMSLLGVGTFAIYGTSITYGDIQETTVSALQNNKNGLTGNSFAPNAMVLGLAFARSLTDKFSFGVTAKYVTEDLYVDKISVVAFDGGMYYNTGYRSIQIGVALRNFGPQIKYVNQEFPLPQTVAMGLDMYLLSPEGLLGQSSIHNIHLTADLLQPRDYDEQYLFGLEYSLNDILFLRGGYKLNFDEEDYTLGAGIKLLRYTIDYAFNNYGLYLESVHRFSFGFCFD